MDLSKKIEELKVKMSSQRDAFNLKLTEAKEKAAAGEVDEAKKLKDEAESLKEKLSEINQQIEDLEDLEGMEEETDEELPPEDEDVPPEDNELPPSDEDLPPLKKKKGAERSMKKKKETLLEENEGVKNFEDYLRSRGQTRDGLTTINQSILVPKEVSTDIFRLKESGFNLVQLVTVKQVGKQSGTFPIAKRSVSATLKTKAELAVMDEVEADMFFPVDYKVETRAGQIALSEEAIDDIEVNIVAEVKNQMRRIVDNTNNVNIIALLETFTKKTATTVDEIKTVKNTQLDPALALGIITNQDGYNWMDLQKDENGRYLLQDSISAQSGKKFLGLDVAVVPNWLLKSKAAGYPMFMGDFKESVALFDRKKVEVEWKKFDSYSVGLATVIRNDYEIIDPDATIFMQVKEATTP